MRGEAWDASAGRDWNATRETLRLEAVLEPYELVSNRRPAITAKAWPWLVKTVIHWPRPRSPQRRNEPESSGLFSRLAW